MSKKNEKIDPKALAKELLNDRTHGAAKAGPGSCRRRTRSPRLQGLYERR